MNELRYSIVWEPTEGERLILADGMRQLGGEPEESMEIAVVETDYIGWAWGETQPTGNRRVRYSFEVYTNARSVAEMEAGLRAHKMSMIDNPCGHLTIYEAYYNGTPSIATRWSALLTGISGGLVREAADAIPYNPGSGDPLKGSAVGRVRYEFTLTNPESL